MARDNSPVPNTCKFIDKAIEVLNDSECSYNTVDIQAAIAALETVRSYNEELREWGNEQYQRANEAEPEVARLEHKLETEDV